jgi:predicted nucleic acid-binding protein
MKFPNRMEEIFLRKLSFTLIHTPMMDVFGMGFYIRDDKDYPILASAIVADVDVLITGDKDFNNVNVDRPELLTIADFMKYYR